MTIHAAHACCDPHPPLRRLIDPFTAAPGAIPYARYLEAQNRVHRAGPIATTRGISPAEHPGLLAPFAHDPCRIDHAHQGAASALRGLLPSLGHLFPPQPRTYLVTLSPCGNTARIDLVRQPGPTGRLLDLVV